MGLKFPNKLLLASAAIIATTVIALFSLNFAVKKISNIHPSPLVSADFSLENQIVEDEVEELLPINEPVLPQKSAVENRPIDRDDGEDNDLNIRKNRKNLRQYKTTDDNINNLDIRQKPAMENSARERSNAYAPSEEYYSDEPAPYYDSNFQDDAMYDDSYNSYPPDEEYYPPPEEYYHDYYDYRQDGESRNKNKDSDKAKAAQYLREYIDYIDESDELIEDYEDDYITDYDYY